MNILASLRPSRLILCALGLSNGLRTWWVSEALWPVVHNPILRQGKPELILNNETLPVFVGAKCSFLSGDILRRETGQSGDDSPMRNSFRCSSSETVTVFLIFNFCFSALSFFTNLCWVWRHWWIVIYCHRLSGTSGNSCSGLGRGRLLADRGWPLLEPLWGSALPQVSCPPPGSNRIAQKCSFHAKGGNTKEQTEIHKVSWGLGSKRAYHHFCLIYGPKQVRWSREIASLWGEGGLQIHSDGGMDMRGREEREP